MAKPQDPGKSGTGGMKPGDEAPPGTPGTGEDLCPECNGSGRMSGKKCDNCRGTGRITEAIGGA
jgi:DnaJ-class molecular chaperone